MNTLQNEYLLWICMKDKELRLPTKNIVHLADNANNEDDSNK